MIFDQWDVLNCRGNVLDLSHPIVMGILNLTPDSFYDGGQFTHPESVEHQMTKMCEDGATIIDVGPMSSRPGANLLSASDQIERLKPYRDIFHRFSQRIFLSIDTYLVEVAEYAMNLGFHIINDISGGLVSPEIIDLAIEKDAPFICMHMKGNPQNMQLNPQYEDVTLEVLDYFIERVGTFREKKLKDIIIDPGFGFGKTVDHNFQLIKELQSLHILELPILIGISRKSMITKFLGIEKQDALSATSALHMYGLQKEAKILRVHDVKEAKETIKLFEKVNEKLNSSF